MSQKHSIQTASKDVLGCIMEACDHVSAYNLAKVDARLYRAFLRWVKRLDNPFCVVTFDDVPLFRWVIENATNRGKALEEGWRACVYQSAPKTFEWMLQWCNPNWNNKWAMLTLLRSLNPRRSVECLRVLFNDPLTDYTITGAMQIAYQCDNGPAIRLLFEICNESSEYILKCAMSFNRLDVFKRLHAAAVQPCAHNYELFDYACDEQREEFVKYLLPLVSEQQIQVRYRDYTQPRWIAKMLWEELEIRKRAC
jgi:hypothetical protein